MVAGNLSVPRPSMAFPEQETHGNRMRDTVMVVAGLRMRRQYRVNRPATKDAARTGPMSIDSPRHGAKGACACQRGGRSLRRVGRIRLRTTATCGPTLRRRPRRGWTGTCMPSPSSAAFPGRFSTTTIAAWCRASWRTGRASGRVSSAGSCRITSCATATGGRARGTTRARSRVWWASPGATSWCPLPRFASWEAFNLRLEEQCRSRQGDILRGHRETIERASGAGYGGHGRAAGYALRGL